MTQSLTSQAWQAFLLQKRRECPTLSAPTGTQLLRMQKRMARNPKYPVPLALSLDEEFWTSLPATDHPFSLHCKKIPFAPTQCCYCPVVVAESES
jgi:hypothetical protein